MHGLGDHAFAGAALAQQQQIGVCARDLQRHIDGGLHRFVFAAQFRRAGPGLTLQAVEAVEDAACVDLSCDRNFELIWRTRLDQIIAGPECDRFHRIVDGRVAGNHDNPHQRSQLA